MNRCGAEGVWKTRVSSQRAEDGVGERSIDGLHGVVGLPSTEAAEESELADIILRELQSPPVPQRKGGVRLERQTRLQTP